jgi:tetratricopeptide (TPR) repeat protein
MKDSSLDFCPYKGLQPYTEADRAFFFGRERDCEIIISNLHAARVTILYGPPGVGKSSILLAGVLPKLRQLPRILPIMFRDWQNAEFETALKDVLLSAVPDPRRKVGIDPQLPIDELILKLIGPARSTMFVLFDQFEEYFFYSLQSLDANRFEAEFASAINRPEIDVHFLLSLRDDSISNLDRFHGRIPALLMNMLPLHHLDRQAAEAAIRKPLDKYNRERSTSGSRVDIETGLVEALLKELRMGKVTLEQGGGGHLSMKPSNELRIETPFLQMVLTRLWAEEMRVRSQMLRLYTLQKMGGAERIVRSHLDKVMSNLPGREREIAARIFRFLVTPTGEKIALTANDLASFTEIPINQIEPALTLLSSTPHRILRPVAPPPYQKGQTRYEIFHDVLAAGIIDWRSRYFLFKERELAALQVKEEREREEQQARALRRQHWLQAMTGVVVALALLASVAVLQWRRAEKARAYAESKRVEADGSRAEALNAKKETEDALKKLDESSSLFGEQVQSYVFEDARKSIKKGDKEAALKKLDRILKLSQKAGNHNVEGQMLTFIGFFYQTSNPTKALEYYNRAVKAQSQATPLNEIQLAVSLDNLGLMAFKLRNFQETAAAHGHEFVILDGMEESDYFTKGVLSRSARHYLDSLREIKSTKVETARLLTQRVLTKYGNARSKR